MRHKARPAQARLGQAPVRVMRGDADATVVRAHILDGGEPADLSHAQARFEAVKPDGTWVREEAAAKPGGVVEYVLPPQVSAVEGLIEGACFRLVRDGAVDSAGPFAIEVLPSIESAGAGESGSYCPELDGLMDEMRQLIVDGGARTTPPWSASRRSAGRTLEGTWRSRTSGVVELGNVEIESMFNEEDGRKDRTIAIKVASEGGLLYFLQKLRQLFVPRELRTGSSSGVQRCCRTTT